MKHRTLWGRKPPTRAGGSATGLVSPFIRHKSSLASPHVIAAKIRTTPLGNTLQVPHPRLERDDKKAHYSAGTSARQATEERTAAGQEAASAQAVKRGHTVTMIEVPDPDDDTAYRQWLRKGSPVTSPKRKSVELLTPPDSPPKTTSPLPNEGVGPTCVPKDEVTSPTVATPTAASAKVKEAPHQWFRLFEVDWTLRAVCEARKQQRRSRRPYSMDP